MGEYNGWVESEEREKSSGYMSVLVKINIAKETAQEDVHQLYDHL